MNIFGAYASYYDSLYSSDKQYHLEADYVAKIIKKHHKNAQTILDLGCGTGKHALLLAEKGFQVQGKSDHDPVRYSPLDESLLFRHRPPLLRGDQREGSVHHQRAAAGRVYAVGLARGIRRAAKENQGGLDRFHQGWVFI